MTGGQVYDREKSEKLVLNYTTLGFPIIRGFPSHEWNDTHALTMTGGQ